MVRKMNAARAEYRVEAEASADQQVQQQFLWADLSDASAVESPARRLQMKLEQSLAAPDASRWSKRRALAFIVVTSAILWTALMAGARALL